MEPSRRNFLKGLIEGATATSLIVAAQPEDIAAFANPFPGKEVVLGAPDAVGYPLGAGQFLFNQYGQPVCIVDRIWNIVDDLDMTRASGTFQQTIVPGLIKEVRLEAVVYGTYRANVVGKPARFGR